MRATLVRGQERAFQMDADWLRARVRAAHFEREFFERAKGHVDVGSDRGGELCAHAVPAEKSADDAECLGGAFHDVVPGAAVDVHVKKRGQDGRAREVENLACGEGFGGRIANLGNDAVFDDDKRAGDFALR